MASGSPQPGPTPPPTSGSLTIAPLDACILPGGTQQFTATLTHISGSGVNWSVDSVVGGNSTVGTISSAGLYTAPSASGQHAIAAVSQADSKASANATIAVNPSPDLTVSPDSATVLVSSQQAFQAQTCGAMPPSLSWTVDGVPGGSDSIGTISAGGVYTAPPSAGTHKVHATDSAMHTDNASVTVTSGIVADFGSRSDTRYPIPAGILGINHADWFYAQAQEAQVAQAGFTLSRTYAKVSDIYATQQPNWSAIDPQMTKLQATGFHVLMQLAFTPAWLRSNISSCGSDPTKAAPADVNAWALLAKSIVAHMDQKFRGVVTEYEIWNEPDTGGMCGTSNKLASYLALYAAAAPAIKQQAATDHVSVRVGGPALSSMNQTWIQSFLSNSSTAPNVDFVSYHQYFAGSSNITAPWSTIYALTQNTTTGAAPTFAAAAQLVAAGKQPQASHTPVYVDEFNTNWAFMKECCRNDPTYAPVWNALYVSDLLNTVYSGTPHLPGQLTYYAAVSLPYFCVVGDWNANMDCSHASGAPVPYPQYYAYQLMASSSYLGMNQGGYMASTISSLPVGRGIAATAFYTAKQDSILIVNPTSSSYSDTVRFQNAGLPSPSATLYKVVGGKSISKASLKLTESGGVFTAPITIPPYTVLGISIQ
jgi:Glycosyl hydrolases family 39